MPTDTNPYCVCHHMNQKEKKPWKSILKGLFYASETNFDPTSSSFCILIYTKTSVYACRHCNGTASGKTTSAQYGSEIKWQKSESRHEYTSTVLASGFVLFYGNQDFLFVSSLQIEQNKYKSLKRNLKINDLFERASCSKCVTTNQQRLERAWVCLGQI